MTQPPPIGEDDIDYATKDYVDYLNEQVVEDIQILEETVSSIQDDIGSKEEFTGSVEMSQVNGLENALAGKADNSALDVIEEALAGKAAGSDLSAIEQRLTGHIDDKNNPHEVTAEQVGARPDDWLPTLAELGITAGTTELTAGTSPLANGEVYLMYE